MFTFEGAAECSPECSVGHHSNQYIQGLHRWKEFGTPLRASSKCFLLLVMITMTCCLSPWNSSQKNRSMQHICMQYCTNNEQHCDILTNDLHDRPELHFWSIAYTCRGKGREGVLYWARNCGRTQGINLYKPTPAHFSFKCTSSPEEKFMVMTLYTST